MSCSYKVIPEHKLLLVRYAGHHETWKTDQLIPFYENDPQVVPGLRCLIDCSQLESAKIDVEKRRTQMHKLLSVLKNPDADWEVIYFCPTTISQSLTDIHRKMWENTPGIDVLDARDLKTVADKLGQSVDRIESILASSQPEAFLED